MMSKHLSPTALRKDLFNILDAVVATGVPVEINRRGRTLKIVLEDKPSRMDVLARYAVDDLIAGDPEELVSVDLTTWSEQENL